MSNKKPKRNQTLPLVAMTLVMASGMTAYAYIKQLIAPHSPMWASQIVMVFFSSFLAAIAAYFILGRNRKSEGIERMEETLRETEARLRQIIDLVPHMIFAKDRNGRFILINQAMAEAYGTTVENLTGAMQADYHPSKTEVTRFLKDDREVIESGRPKVIAQETFVDFHGNQRLLQAIKIPYTLSGSSEPAVLGVAVDITEQRRLETALQDSKSNVRTVLDSVLDGIIIINADGIVETFNPAAERIFNYAPAEIIGQNLKILMPEPYQSTHDEYVQKYLQSEKAKIIGIGREVEGLRKNGESFPLEIEVSEMWVEGQRKFIGIVRDIGDRKKAEDALRESERRLSTLMGNLPGMAYRCLNDKNWTMKFISEGGRQLTGYRPADFINNKVRAFQDLIHPDDRGPLWDQVQQSLQKRQSFQVSYRIMPATGKEKWVWEQGSGVFSDNGTLRALEGFIIDITDRKAAEEALRKLNEELEKRIENRTAELKQANQALQESLQTLQKTQEHLVQSAKMAALGGLVAGVAHEINTPVGIGVTAASYLEMKTAELSKRFTSGNLKKSEFEKYMQKVSEASASILTNLNRAADLVKSFKQVAVDQASEKRRRFRLKDYLDQVLLSLRPKYKRTGHTIRVDCPEDLELASFPAAFYQIVSNLVINSLVHGFEGIETGKIALNVSVEDHKLLFRYSDNGNGIPPENVKKIFDPFFTTKRGQGGSGLGMHLVYNLVTQTLGGQIECDSTPGQGTVFIILIPLNSMPESESALE